MATRIEHDSMGDIPVDNERLWGAQTQRSLQYFHISTERLPPELIRALALVKRECARVNLELSLLEPDMAEAIMAAADEVLSDAWMDEFPLRIWQTGSGTQSNMNMNEVLANRASILLGGSAGLNRLVHPNDHVNLGQSSNDIFPTAMHVAAVQATVQGLLPALQEAEQQWVTLSARHEQLIKIGRTHLQDATPLTVGQEFSGYVAQLAYARTVVQQALPAVHELAVGGTAVGTGLNTHPEFGSRVAQALSRATGQPFVSASNKFAALAAHDALVNLHGALRTSAAALTKIANDVRWLASGPRCGLGELSLPANEPGSSIMPGKVNPTQCEALTMACYQVLGNDVAVGFAGASGHFELNTFKPLIAHNVLQSLRLLEQATRSFSTHALSGLTVNEAQVSLSLQNSLMLVTALAPHLGYDRASQIAQKAHADGSSLREAALALGCAAADFDRWVRPELMI